LIDFRRWVTELTVTQGPSGAAIAIKTYAKWFEFYAAWNREDTRPKVDTRARGVRTTKSRGTFYTFPFLRGVLSIDKTISAFWDGQEPSQAAQIELAQMSKFGRALPPGGYAILDQTVRQHYENAKTKRVADDKIDSISRLMHSFGRRYTKRYAKERKSAHISLSLSASLRTGRKSGGRIGEVVVDMNRFLREDLDESSKKFAKGANYLDVVDVLGIRHRLFDGETVGEALTGSRKIDEQSIEFASLAVVWATFRAEHAGYDFGVLSEADFILRFGKQSEYKIRFWKERPKTYVSSECTQPLTVRMTPLAEDGCKGRGVTCDESFVTILLHLARCILYGDLENNPRSTANGTTLWHFIQSFREESCVKYAISSDLRAATDTFDVRLNGALYDGLSLGHPHEYLLGRLRAMAVDPKRIVYPLRRFQRTGELAYDPLLDSSDLAIDAEVTVERDEHKAILFMGAPTTYSELSAHSDFQIMAAESLRRYRKSTKGRHARLADLKFVKIIDDFLGRHQGDDISVFHNDPEFGVCLAIVQDDLGLQRSEGSWHVSEHFATFCEEVAVRQKGERWQFADVVKFRPLCSTLTTPARPGERGRADPIVTRGQSIEQQMAYFSGENDPRRRACLEVMISANKRLHKFLTCSDRKIFTLPTFASGLSYPSAYSFAKQWRKLVAQNIKNILSSLLLEDLSVRSAIRRTLLSVSARPQKKGEYLDEDELVDMLSQVGQPIRDKETKITNSSRGKVVDAETAWEMKAGEDSSLGIIKFSDIVEMTRRFGGPLAEVITPDRSGKTVDEPGWGKRRWLLAEIPLRTPYAPLSKFIEDLTRTNFYSQSLIDPKSIKRRPQILNLGAFKAARKKTVRSAMLRMGELGVGPRIKPKSWGEVRLELAKASSIYIDRRDGYMQLLQKNKLLLAT